MILKELEEKELKKQKSKCAILIDGSNFYFKLKDLKLHNLLKFDFSGFAKMLCGKNKIIRTTYYVGRIKTDGTGKTKKLFDDQQRLLGHLKNHQIRYVFGYLMKTDRKYHEKGVDVNIAVREIPRPHGCGTVAGQQRRGFPARRSLLVQVVPIRIRSDALALPRVQRLRLLRDRS